MGDWGNVVDKVNLQEEGSPIERHPVKGKISPATTGSDPRIGHFELVGEMGDALTSFKISSLRRGGGRRSVRFVEDASCPDFSRSGG